MQDLFDAIADASGCKRVTTILPAGLAKVLAVISETVSKITRKSTLLTRFTIYNLVRNNNFSSEKAVKSWATISGPFRKPSATKFSGCARKAGSEGNCNSIIQQSS